ncbi:hypothetical protein TIFTF001_024073 [Ficus carica]|uniref:Potassium channel domain-containing protein n=1 Tax=Ficus carica TaxID=3494 RepID=A0AA88AMQ8_FICCA|nr:hypothetical protein TIFTF001_024073 [Ficus carica]
MEEPLLSTPGDVQVIESANRDSLHDVSPQSVAHLTDNPNEIEISNPNLTDVQGGESSSQGSSHVEGHPTNNNDDIGSSRTNLTYLILFFGHHFLFDLWHSHILGKWCKQGDLTPLSQSFILALIDALYYLTVTFSTVGYGDIIPHARQSIFNRIGARLLSCMDQGRVTSFLCYIDEDGYGDFYFKMNGGRVFAIMWLVISTFIVSKTIFYVCEVLISKLLLGNKRRDSGPYEEAEKCMKMLRERKLTVANITNMLSNITTKDRHKEELESQKSRIRELEEEVATLRGKYDSLTREVAQRFTDIEN